MPSRSKRPCAKLGCPNLTDSGRYCSEHASQSQRYDDRASAASRGYDAAWRKIRLQALARDSHCCVLCRAQGKTVPASPVDHIIPVKQQPDLRLVLSNLQSLCKPCHDRKTASERNCYQLR